MEPNVQKGVPIDIIIKIKPEPHQRQDLRVYENKISLCDQYDRAVDEFVTNGSIIDGTDGIRLQFDNTFSRYINFLVHGVNLTVFTFGGKGSGKSFCYEGNQNEAGLYGMLIENIFNALDTKRDSILEDIQSLNIPEVEATSFTYSIRMKYLEFKDEAVIDLLQKYNYYKQPTQVIYSESEGYTCNGSAWVSLDNSLSFTNFFHDAIKFRSNYEYNKVNKSATLMIIEISQILESRATRDFKVVNSKVHLFDLPSADILAEHFRNLSNSMEYKQAYSFQNMVGELAKTHNNALPTIYENSILTKMMKEYIGGNGLCVGLFTLQHNNFAISNITFKIMKLCSHIQNFPLLNDVNAHCLLKKFRTDIAYYSKNKNFNPTEIKPPIIPKYNNEFQVKQEEPPADGDKKENKGRLAFLENENRRLMKELEIAQGEMMRNFKASNARAIDPIKDYQMPHERLDVQDKLLHIEDDINETNEIMASVNKLNDKVKVLEQERRELSEQYEALKVNNENLTLEMDRVALESNNYKTNADNELYNLKEMLNSTKNELEYMRAEADKYRRIQSDLLMEIDSREIQFKKSLEDREREIELKMLNLSQNEKRRLEGELREATRKIEHFGEENKEYLDVNKKLKEDNNKLSLQIDEMRSTLRDSLGKDITNKKSESRDKDKLSLVDPSSKEKLIMTYTKNENELIEKFKLEEAKVDNLREKLKKMRTYGRKVRNIALDYFPINEELPDLLTKDINVFLEDAENEGVIQFLEFEIRTLRERNKKLEFEMSRLREEYKLSPYDEYQQKASHVQKGMNTRNLNQSQTNEVLKEQDIQRKILEEISKLKNARPPSSSKDLEKLKQENIKLADEIKRLKTMINDSIVREGNETNDNPKALRQKILFLEKTVEQLEDERSKLMIRATMAEEQLKTFQATYTETNQAYQREILELNKRVS